MTGVDLRRLGEWMDGQGLAPGEIADVVSLGGGTQNILLRFRRGNEKFVLRHPPLHKRANSDDTMMREARVLAALSGTDVPHPGLIVACADLEVLGSAFYLMESVEGTNPTVELPEPYLRDERWRWELGLSMADGAASVAAVDHVAVGLADLGKPEGFLERQVDRWRALLDSYAELDGYPGPDIPGLDAVGKWLEANRPTPSRVGLIHGDIKLANVLCRHDRPALAALVDWELATIGDPLLDLGWLLAAWPDEQGSPLGTGVTPWSGFPERADLIARYAERSDRDLSAISWYEVLAGYKVGIIIEGTYARAFAGLVPMRTGEALHAATVALFRRANSRITET